MGHRWSSAADLRRHQIESGMDITFNKVFLPYYESLVLSYKPYSLLEIGCGTGHLALQLSQHVQVLHAIEPAIGMFSVAKDVLKHASVEIKNCTIEKYSLPICYDMVISHLCIQMTDDLGAFLKATRHVISNSSIFVFSIPHPCFWNNYSKFFQPKEYNYMVEKFKEVTLKITKDRKRPIEGVPYHHRPLNSYFKALKKAGLCVLDFKEIFPEKNVQILYGAEWEKPRYAVFHVIINEGKREVS